MCSTVVIQPIDGVSFCSNEYLCLLGTRAASISNSADTAGAGNEELDFSCRDDNPRSE